MEIKFAKKYKPLFDILVADKKLLKQSLLGLTKEQIKRFNHLLNKQKDSIVVKNKKLLEEVHQEILSLREFGLNDKELIILSKWIKLNAIDTVILTGGRGSAKSFVMACFSLIALTHHLWNVLYTRFTNVSIVDSIKPEVDDKIDLLGLSNYLNSTNSHIEKIQTKEEIKKGTLPSRIAFKGIKTGSKKQTANLKSLFGFNCFVVDEAEELPDYETYEKVFLSIRSKDKRNLTILILNSASIHHWIYRTFFEAKQVDGGSNTIKDNICYIHTSYLDVEREYLADNIVNYYERLKIENPKKYEHVVMGGWIEAVEGRVFTDWTRNKYADFLNIPKTSFFGIDWGKNHKFGIVEQKYDSYTNTLYNHERNYLSENEIIGGLTELERKNINNPASGGVIIHTVRKLGIPKDAYLVCDSARPDNILLLRKFGWEYAYGIDKPKGSVMAGITLLHSTNVVYTEESKGIDLEFKNYSYAEDRLGVVDDEVIKAYDDVIDPIRYGRRHAKNKNL